VSDPGDAKEIKAQEKSPAVSYPHGLAKSHNQWFKTEFSPSFRIMHPLTLKSS